MMITLTYRIETPGSFEAMAEKIASDQSTGTFVPVPGETEELKARVAARVLAIRPLEDGRHPTWPEVAPGTLLHRADVDIGFPLEAIGPDLSALMTIAIGDVFSRRIHHTPVAASVPMKAIESAAISVIFLDFARDFPLGGFTPAPWLDPRAGP